MGRVTAWRVFWYLTYLYSPYLILFLNYWHYWLWFICFIFSRSSFHLEQLWPFKVTLLTNQGPALQSPYRFCDADAIWQLLSVKVIWSTLMNLISKVKPGCLIFFEIINLRCLLGFRAEGNIIVANTTTGHSFELRLNKYEHNILRMSIVTFTVCNMPNLHLFAKIFKPPNQIIYSYNEKIARKQVFQKNILFKSFDNMYLN